LTYQLFGMSLRKTRKHPFLNRSVTETGRNFTGISSASNNFSFVVACEYCAAHGI
jgi:hypothetical protein